MQNGLIRKGLVFSVIVLFIGIGIQPVLSVEIKTPIVNKEGEEYIEIVDENNDKGDFGLGFIFCTVSATDWSSRKHYPLVRNVKFELTDYDTGEIIQEKFRSFGIHLFTFLPRGHSYVIKASFSEGSDTYKVGDLDFFQWAPIDIIYF